MVEGTFKVKSVGTNAVIVDVNVIDGQPVQLGTGNALTLTIDPQPTSGVTVCTFYDPNTGLYIGPNDIPSAGDNVTWVTDVYSWNIAKSNSDNYVIFPSGLDLYWAQNSTISPYVELIPGSDIRDNEGFWILQPVD